jgi:hypothetical protein
MQPIDQTTKPARGWGDIILTIFFSLGQILAAIALSWVTVSGVDDADLTFKMMVFAGTIHAAIWALPFSIILAYRQKRTGLKVNWKACVVAGGAGILQFSMAFNLVRWFDANSGPIWGLTFLLSIALAFTLAAMYGNKSVEHRAN